MTSPSSTASTTPASGNSPSSPKRAVSSAVRGKPSMMKPVDLEKVEVGIRIFVIHGENVGISFLFT